MSVPMCPRTMERDESKARIGRAEVAPHEAAMRRDGPAARAEKCVFFRKLERFFLTVVGIKMGPCDFVDCGPWDPPSTDPLGGLYTLCLPRGSAATVVGGRLLAFSSGARDLCEAEAARECFTSGFTTLSTKGASFFLVLESVPGEKGPSVLSNGFRRMCEERSVSQEGPQLL